MFYSEEHQLVIMLCCTLVIQCYNVLLILFTQLKGYNIVIIIVKPGARRPSAGAHLVS